MFLVFGWVSRVVGVVGRVGRHVEDMMSGSVVAGGAGWL